MKILEQKKMNGQLAWVGKQNVRMCAVILSSGLKDVNK